MVRDPVLFRNQILGVLILRDNGEIARKNRECRAFSVSGTVPAVLFSGLGHSRQQRRTRIKRCVCIYVERMVFDCRVGFQWSKLRFP